MVLHDSAGIRPRPFLPRRKNEKGVILGCYTAFYAATAAAATFRGLLSFLTGLVDLTYKLTD